MRTREQMDRDLQDVRDAAAKRFEPILRMRDEIARKYQRLQRPASALERRYQAIMAESLDRSYVR